MTPRGLSDLEEADLRILIQALPDLGGHRVNDGAHKGNAPQGVNPGESGTCRDTAAVRERGRGGSDVIPGERSTATGIGKVHSDLTCFFYPITTGGI